MELGSEFSEDPAGCLISEFELPQKYIGQKFAKLQQLYFLIVIFTMFEKKHKGKQKTRKSSILIPGQPSANQKSSRIVIVTAVTSLQILYNW